MTNSGPSTPIKHHLQCWINSVMADRLFGGMFRCMTDQVHRKRVDRQETRIDRVPR